MLPVIYRSIVATGIALALWAPASFAASDCGLKQIASVPIEVTANNLLMMDVTINGIPVKMRVDTGGATSVLNQKFADRAGLPVESMQAAFYGLTGRALDRKTRVETLRLGSAVSRNADFAIMPAGDDGTGGEPVGLFGADYLQNYDVEFDFAGGKMNLFDHQHCVDRVVYWAPEFFKSGIHYATGSILHTPMMNIAVDGKNMLGLIDTGAPTTVMRLATAEGRLDLSLDSPDVHKIGQGTGVEGVKLDTYTHVFKSLTFGDITLHDTTMMIMPINTAAHVEKIGSHLKENATDEPDVLVGMSLLKMLHVYLSYSENALYYTIGKPKQAAAP